MEHHHSHSRRSFWRDVFTISGTTNPRILLQVLMFGLVAEIYSLFDLYVHPNLGIEVTLMEFAGAALGLLLVLRTNEGYGRWWEARKLWGALVNNARNLAIQTLAYGPDDPEWRSETLKWIAAFGHIARRSLRGQRDIPEVARIVGEPEAARISTSPHMPTYVAYRIALQFERGVELGMDRIAMLRLDSERGLLIDEIGGCERILKTPLPWVYAVQLRRFIAIYLLTLPLALISKLGWWPTPLVTMMVAYPILGLDRIAVELQNPFSQFNLNHLPLDAISRTIEVDVLALGAVVGGPERLPSPPVDIASIAD
jgi:putative membrane protein